MKVLLLNAHPGVGSFADPLAAACEDGAREGGHDIKSIALRDLRFDLVLRGGFHNQKPLEPDITEQQVLIQWQAPSLDHSLRVRAYIPEPDLSRVASGMKVRRSAEAGQPRPSAALSG